MNCATTTHCALVLFAILSGAPNALASYCPNGWTHGNLNYPTALDKTRGNFCYKFFDSSKFWVDAEAMCVSESAHLMSIHSADEQVIATGLCGSTQQSRCWIGFNDKQAGTNCEGLNGCVANYNTNGPWYGSDGSLGNGNPNYSGSQWIDNDNDPNNAAGHSPCSGQACAARNFGYEDWSGSGEPNNYNNGGAGSWKGEHCSECWSRCTSWNDMPCQGAVYSKFACKKPANVFPGYYSTSGSPAVGDFGKYFDMRPCPAGRYNAGITDPRNGQYGVGVCSLCPAGTFAVGVADPDGTVSNPGAASSACGGNCAPGFYCTAGSTRNDPPAGRCPGTPFICRHLDYCCCLYFLLVLIFFFPSAGRYGTGGSTDSLCSGPCDAGCYCVAGSNQACAAECPAGTYGNGGSTNAACSGDCPAGYYCPQKTSSSTKIECGGDQYYCPGGSQSPLDVPAGYYATGGSSQTRTSIEICPKGSYCTGGVIVDCPGGYYGQTTGLSTSDCSGKCQAGFYCPTGGAAGGSIDKYGSPHCGSTAGDQRCDCGRETGGSFVTDAANHYCAAGSALPGAVAANKYSYPLVDLNGQSWNVNRRESQKNCETGYTCLNGIR
jgi:hypothetical protein